MRGQLFAKWPSRHLPEEVVARHPRSSNVAGVRRPQPLHEIDLRECDQKRGALQCRQFRGARGRQLAQAHSGQRPHRQNGVAPAMRTTTLAPHSGQSRRHRTLGRGSRSASRSRRNSSRARRSARRSLTSLFCHRQTVATWTPANSAASRSVYPSRIASRIVGSVAALLYIASSS